MTDLISFHIYRTESIELKGEHFTAYFSKRTDGEEYALFAVNHSKSKSWRAFYTSEIASDFEQATGQKLEEEVYKVLQSDIESGAL